MRHQALYHDAGYRQTTTCKCEMGRRATGTRWAQPCTLAPGPGLVRVPGWGAVRAWSRDSLSHVGPQAQGPASPPSPSLPPFSILKHHGLPAPTSLWCRHELQGRVSSSKALMKLTNFPTQRVLVSGELIMCIANLLDAWEKYTEEHSVSETILGKVTEACGKNPCAILRRKSE